MNLTDRKIQEHLISGGKIRLSRLKWVYAKVSQGQLWWYREDTGVFCGCVEAFNDIISKEWEIINDEDSVFRPGMSKTLRPENFANGTFRRHRSNRYPYR
jgi:hypothetical protein